MTCLDQNSFRNELRDRLIVALDLSDLHAAETLVRRLRPVVRWFKVGSELFTAAGPAAVAMVHDRGGRVFLDLKFHDIPTTVARAVSAAARLQVAMTNVHIAGGERMLREAARANRSFAPAPLLIGVTLLTSLQAEDALQAAADAARLALACELDGVVASARDAQAIKAACGARFIVVAPGIRPRILSADDQRRTATPGEAISWCADYLVVGRPITQAEDPRVAAERILDEMTVAA